jgi:hypothetical protein
MPNGYELKMDTFNVLFNFFKPLSNVLKGRGDGSPNFVGRDWEDYFVSGINFVTIAWRRTTERRKKGED